MSVLNAVTGIVNSVLGIGTKFIADKDKLNEFKHAVETQTLSMLVTEFEKQAEVIIAEAKGESYLQRNWRPILMLTFVAIIANNYILAPYLQLLISINTTLPIPDQMWDLLKLGIGGYIVGRSVEKGIKAWTEKKLLKD